MKRFALNILCIILTLTFSCNGKDKRKNNLTSDFSTNRCTENFDFSGALTAIISEEHHGAPLFKKLYDAGIESIKVASNLAYEKREISMDDRTINFIPDTNIRLPRIILAIGTKCKLGKFEFGTERFTILGSLSKVENVWNVEIEDVIEID